jgi:hypothetical protein
VTRKDYLLIAKALRKAYRIAGDRPMPYASDIMQNVESVSIMLADALAADNPRFDREHFLAVVRGERELNSKPVPKPSYQPYQPKTGQRCGCKRGEQRDNCPRCEGTGWVIDFAAIRNRSI